MKATARLIAVLLLATAAAAAGTAGTDGTAAPQQTASVEQKDPAEILGDPYTLTWEKDPRYQGRDPFDTVLHFVGGEKRRVHSIDVPRTPSEESAFVTTAASLIDETDAALEVGDFEAAAAAVETLRKMQEIELVTGSARERMLALAESINEVEGRLDTLRARAALKKALEIASKMSAYFETERYGEVVGLYKQLEALNDEDHLKDPEVAETAGKVIEKCAELDRRARVHIEFSEMEISIDAVSDYPEGRSFAIVNGEVTGEGESCAGDLRIASVEGKEVIFDYKGERIGLELSE